MFREDVKPALLAGLFVVYALVGLGWYFCAKNDYIKTNSFSLEFVSKGLDMEMKNEFR
ncbi:MAG: hypothetical protein U9O83_02860 [Campylobacterota bacterium]|nr:hypothetical protein [Campylobacterota bacterium]